MAQKGGRPTVITAEVVSKLTEAFHKGLTIREACWQAGVSHEAYYQRVRKDWEFADKMDSAQRELTIRAKMAVSKAVQAGDLAAAKWWLEHKAQKEFGKSQFDDEALPESYLRSQRMEQKMIDGIDRIICLHYRAHLFVLRQQQEKDNTRNKPINTRVDKLIELPDSTLADYIELEIYATGQDKANVKEWIGQRVDMRGSMKKSFQESELV